MLLTRTKTIIMKPIIVFLTQASGPPERVFWHLPLQGADERLLRPLWLSFQFEMHQPFLWRASLLPVTRVFNQEISWHSHTCRALKQFECQRPDHTFCQVQEWTFLFALDIPKKLGHLSIRTFCLAISAATTWAETFPTQPAQIQSGPWGLF